MGNFLHRHGFARSLVVGQMFPIFTLADVITLSHINAEFREFLWLRERGLVRLFVIEPIMRHHEFFTNNTFMPVAKTKQAFAEKLFSKPTSVFECTKECKIFRNLGISIRGHTQDKPMMAAMEKIRKDAHQIYHNDSILVPSMEMSALFDYHTAHYLRKMHPLGPLSEFNWKGFYRFVIPWVSRNWRRDPSKEISAAINMLAPAWLAKLWVSTKIKNDPRCSTDMWDFTCVSRLTLYPPNQGYVLGRILKRNADESNDSWGFQDRAKKSQGERIRPPVLESFKHFWRFISMIFVNARAHRKPSKSSQSQPKTPKTCKTCIRISKPKKEETTITLGGIDVKVKETLITFDSLTENVMIYEKARSLIGYVGLDGVLHPTNKLGSTSSRMRIIQALNVPNPGSTCGQIGIICGTCVFCASRLTDSASKKRGYGPTCMVTYGLDDRKHIFGIKVGSNGVIKDATDKAPKPKRKNKAKINQKPKRKQQVIKDASSPPVIEDSPNLKRKQPGVKDVENKALSTKCFIDLVSDDSDDFGDSNVDMTPRKKKIKRIVYSDSDGD